MSKQDVNTKDKILNVSAKLFSKRGYYGVSMEEIAYEVGISKSAIYYHFESKEELLRTLLQNSCAKLKDALTNAVKDSEDPFDCVFKIVEAIINYGISNPEIKILNSVGITDNDDMPITKLIFDLRTELLIFIREILETFNVFRKWTFRVLYIVSMNILSFALNPFINETDDSEELAQNFSSLLSKSVTKGK